MQLAGACLDQVKDKNIRHVVDRGGGIAQIIQQVQHPLQVAYRQGNEYDVDGVLLGVGAEVRQTADQLHIRFQLQPVGPTIVEESFHRHRP